MLFQRRRSLHLMQRLKLFVWPRTGWRRAGEYVWHRLSRLRGSPHSIAIGFAAGVFASFTPFMGFHFMIGFALAYAIRGSLIASAFGTFVGNPLTFPFIWVVTYKLGAFLLGIERPVTEVEAELELSTNAWWMVVHDPTGLWKEFLKDVWTLIRPMTVGGVPLGILAGLLLYFPVARAITVFQEARRHRRELRQAERLGKLKITDPRASPGGAGLP